MRDCRCKIAPSMMCADFLHLADELEVFARHGIEWMHVDVMDGHYVRNFTLGVDFCRALQSGSAIPLQIHLVVQEADRHVDQFLELRRPIRMVFHPETVAEPVRLIEFLHDQGAQSGIAVKPDLSLDEILYLVPLVEEVLVMTVNPGFAGQQMIPSTLGKVTEMRRYLDEKGLTTDLGVDGNVSWANMGAMREAGATLFVAGTSSIFGPGIDRGDGIQRMRALLQAAQVT